jgi:hypothetical protein
MDCVLYMAVREYYWARDTDSEYVPPRPLVHKMYVALKVSSRETRFFPRQTCGKARFVYIK